MTQQFRLTKPAIQDIKEITEYLAQTSGLPTSEKFLDQLNQKLRKITLFPNLGRQRNEIYPNVRSITLNSYLILYIPNNLGIDILRIVSGYRNLTTLFED